MFKVASHVMAMPHQFGLERTHMEHKTRRANFEVQWTENRHFSQFSAENFDVLLSRSVRHVEYLVDLPFRQRSVPQGQFIKAHTSGCVRRSSRCHTVSEGLVNGSLTPDNNIATSCTMAFIYIQTLCDLGFSVMINGEFSIVRL